MNLTDEIVSTSDNLADLELLLFYTANRSTDFSYIAKQLREFVNFLTNDLRNDAAYESCYSAARRRVPVTRLL